jgi:hypothetical protein
VQVVKGGGEVELAGGVVVEGTLVVEVGTRIHTQGAVVLTSTMELGIILLSPDTLENGTVEIEIILCTSLHCQWMCVCLSVGECVQRRRRLAAWPQRQCR